MRYKVLIQKCSDPRWRVRERGDIFYIENNRSLNRIESVCLVVAIIAGMFMSTRKIALIPPDFIEPDAQAHAVMIGTQCIERPQKQREVKTVVIGKISRWQFDKIDKVGDVTEVVYPFVFSQ